MKYAVNASVLCALLGAVLAHAQSQPLPTFEHVIIVIQENRTPDNLFGAAKLNPPQGNLPTLGPGADLQISRILRMPFLGA
jgi:phospholipase C